MIDKNTLYKLPYTKNNNPNGWIEPTTFCQLKCPHCYRGEDNANFKPAERDLEELKREVDELIKQRNIQTLSIGGGEPLLYPHLNELIEYARSKKLQVVVLTNGILLDRKRLIEFKEIGVTLITIHIDKTQGREGVINEEKANAIREKYCRLFREVKGVLLGFFTPVSSDNLDDLKVLANFFRTNSDVVFFAGLPIIKKYLGNPEIPLIKNDQDENEIIPQKIKELFGIEYCCFLGKTRSEKISWLVANSFYQNGRLLGSVDKDAPEFIEEDYYRREGKFTFVSNSLNFSFRKLIFVLKNKSFRKMLLKLRLKGKVSEQVLVVYNMPEKINDHWDFCDGCLDAMFYNGKLIPSCLLERIKKGEDITIK